MARLTKVTLNPLKERIEDIPDLFTSLMSLSLRQAGCDLEPTLSLIQTEHHMALMLDGFERDNARGLIAVTDATAAQVAQGVPPNTALAVAFGDLMRRRPDRIAKKAREHPLPGQSVSEEPDIRALYTSEKGNITAMEKALREKGVDSSFSVVRDAYKAAFGRYS